MSKVVMSLPEGMVKNCLIGGGISLLSYVLLQMVCALLVDRGLLGLTQIYPLVCVTAALASFLGCGYSVWKGKGTSMLSVPVVVVVFLITKWLCAGGRGRLFISDAGRRAADHGCGQYRKRFDGTWTVHGGRRTSGGTGGV